MTNGNNTWLNGQLWTIATASGSLFTINVVHGVYGTQTETNGGTAVYNPDFRVHQPATFIINEEYYGLVMDTKCSIWSNKSSMVPLLFFDLADTWTGSAAKRIAGVSVVPTYINATQVLSWQIFFLSEDGKLARYDFTQNNGILELARSGSFAFAANAPAPLAAGEAYGALKVRAVTAPITATAITSGTTLTVTCVNDFEPGEVVNITGTQQSFLNNQTVTVATASGTQFTAAFTHANYTNPTDTGSAVGYTLWALYGTMTADPRTTQTGLANTANINLYRYIIGSGVWGTITTSPNTGRHNARSLNEMIVARDSKLYILCEDVSSTGGGPWTVANAFGGVTNVNWQVMAYDPDAATWNTSKINGSSPIQYGTNMGANAVTPQQDTDFWFYNINAFLHDVGTGVILVQPNWTTGGNGGSSGLSTLNVSGSTAALSSAQLTTIASSTLLPNDSFIPSVTDPTIHPVSITHARDYATNAERTTFFLHKIVRSQPSTIPIYLAPPSFNWGSPTALTQIPHNNYSAFPPVINSFDKDKWSYGDLGTVSGDMFDRNSWSYPTMLTDNYMHFVRGTGAYDGLSNNSSYGRNAGQALAFLPTYYKFTGGSWKMADGWTDAFTNPYTVGGYAGGYSSTIPLIYGLAAQFGPLSTTSWTLGEFHTWNMCYGNTKFARKLRSSWAQFAGQTFTNTETRTVAQEAAIVPYFIDTDPGTATWTAPTSTTPNTASLTTSYLGWTTAASWNKLDGANAGFDASPVRLIWTPNGFTAGTYAFVPANENIITGSNPYSWTVGANTYVSSSSGEQGGQPSWFAFRNNPQEFWTASVVSPWNVSLDLSVGNAQTVLSYGFRSVWSGSDTPSNIPVSWTLQGSNTGTFTDNGGGPFILDTRTGVTVSRGYAFNVASPASYRYYRLNITATNSGGSPTVSHFRLSTAVLQTTCNFVDLNFFSYGSQVSTSYFYKFIQNRQMVRGLKFEVSTTPSPVYPTNYTQIIPKWRAHNGYVFSFARQSAITAVAITCNEGYAINNTQAGFGPFYLIDYNASQGTIDAARLGNSGAMVGTPAAASFDPNCLGIATDVPNISIDSQNPSLLAPYSTLENGAVHGWWDFYEVQNPTNSPAGASLGSFKLHPFFGFAQFVNGGQDGGVQTIAGTNAVINYQWGRRI